ncbi:hypothetical protein ACP275_13G204600 [Erythranthe tilingii]
MAQRAEAAAAAERQISVDPISLKEKEAAKAEEDDRIHKKLYGGAKMEVISSPQNKFLCKFINCSLPNSPRQQKKKYEEGRVGVMARQHSVAISNLERLRQSHLRRSKSCGEGRLCQPSIDFDMCTTTTTTTTTTNKNKNKMEGHGMNKEEEEEEDGEEEKEKKKEMVFNNKKGGEETYEEKFKCGACMFLPGFGKGKAVKARKDPETHEVLTTHIDMMVSHRASLEKFECGSWRSSAMINYDDEYHHNNQKDGDDDDDDDDDDTSNLFFDLPVELIRCSSVNDTDFPVTTGFMFDNNIIINNNNKDSQRKGVLKTAVGTNNNGADRKSNVESFNSSRHVRFSTSSSPASPTSACITPRLLKARDDFNAFLEAQTA